MFPGIYEHFQQHLSIFLLCIYELLFLSHANPVTKSIIEKNIPHQNLYVKNTERWV